MKLLRMEIDLDRIELTELNQITWPHHGRTWNEFSCWSEQMREIFRLTKEQQYTSLDFENLRHSLDPEKDDSTRLIKPTIRTIQIIFRQSGILRQTSSV